MYPSLPPPRSSTYNFICLNFIAESTNHLNAVQIYQCYKLENGSLPVLYCTLHFFQVPISLAEQAFIALLKLYTMHNAVLSKIKHSKTNSNLKIDCLIIFF